MEMIPTILLDIDFEDGRWIAGLLLVFGNSTNNTFGTKSFEDGRWLAGLLLVLGMAPIIVLWNINL